MRPQLRSRFRIAQPEDTSPPPMATPARTKSSAPNEQGLVLHAIALLVAGLMLRWGESETLLWCGGLLWETGGRLLGSYRPDYTSEERTVPTFFTRFHVSRFPRLGQPSAVNCQSTQGFGKNHRSVSAEPILESCTNQGRIFAGLIFLPVLCSSG